MDVIIAVGTAFWLGILTAISPCPLAANITAISFIGRGVENSRKVFLTGILYTFGRSLAYVFIGAILVYSLVSAPLLSHYLQKYMNLFLGPVLIIVGMILLELISLSFSGTVINEKMQKRFENSGLLGGLFLGIIFALSFCPISAALFFGSLIPLAIKINSPIFIPLIYGIPTGLPVMIFAFIIAFSAQKVGDTYNILKSIEIWFRRITGVLFIVVGIYYSLIYIFGIQL